MERSKCPGSLAHSQGHRRPAHRAPAGSAPIPSGPGIVLMSKAVRRVPRSWVVPLCRTSSSVARKAARLRRSLSFRTHTEGRSSRMKADQFYPLLSISSNVTKRVDRPIRRNRETLWSGCRIAIVQHNLTMVRVFCSRNVVSN